MRRITSHNWQEPAAYLFSALALAVALKLTSIGYLQDSWVGKAGSLIIIAGVLLATSRKIDLIHEKALEFFANHRTTNKDEVRDELRKILQKEPTQEEVKKMEDAIYGAAEADLKPVIEERRRLFKLHEVALVAVGTFINGFGDILFKVVAGAA